MKSDLHETCRITSWGSPKMIHNEVGLGSGWVEVGLCWGNTPQGLELEAGSAKNLIMQWKNISILFKLHNQIQANMSNTKLGSNICHLHILLAFWFLGAKAPPGFPGVSFSEKKVIKIKSGQNKNQMHASLNIFQYETTIFYLSNYFNWQNNSEWPCLDPSEEPRFCLRRD